jgi:hypothetical protein
VHAYGVAGLEPGAIAAQLALFEVLNDPVHNNGPVGPRVHASRARYRGLRRVRQPHGRSPHGLQTASLATPQGPAANPSRLRFAWIDASG